VSARVRFAARLVVLGVATGASCKSKKVEPSIAKHTAPSTVLPRRTAGELEAARTAPMKVSTRTMQVNARPRTYTLVVPELVPRDKPLPIVLVLHGDGGDGSGFHRGFPFESASGDEAILAYPDGLGATWDLDTPAPRNRDLAFLEAIPGDIESSHAVDRTRIFAAGYSSGGFLANFFACYRPTLVRAISSSAGGAPYGLSSTWPNRFPKCPNQAPVATIHLHGARDGGVTIDSGRFAAQYWAYVNGCNEARMETTDVDECTAYQDCKPQKDVVWCAIGDLGHWVWARAAEASWTFFKRS